MSLVIRVVSDVTACDECIMSALFRECSSVSYLLPCLWTPVVASSEAARRSCEQFATRINLLTYPTYNGQQ